MRWWSRLRLGVRSLLERDAVERELHSELQFHLQQLIDEKMAAGMAPEQARLAALRALGPVTQIEERCRDERNVGWMQTTWQDLRFGARMLKKNRSFTAIA